MVVSRVRDQGGIDGQTQCGVRWRHSKRLHMERQEQLRCDVYLCVGSFNSPATDSFVSAHRCKSARRYPTRQFVSQHDAGKWVSTVNQ
jgi:hypothetical protein